VTMMLFISYLHFEMIDVNWVFLFFMATTNNNSGDAPSSSSIIQECFERILLTPTICRITRVALFQYSYNFLEYSFSILEYKYSWLLDSSIYIGRKCCSNALINNTVLLLNTRLNSYIDSNKRSHQSHTRIMRYSRLFFKSLIG
jgi:hypothetical protein